MHMDRFDIDAHLESTYAGFPEAQERPVIGITGNYASPECKLAEGYYKSVVAAGARHSSYLPWPTRPQ